MSEEKTITLKKSDLWKYSTFLLIAVMIIGGIFVFKGTGNSTYANAGATAGATTGGTTDNTDVSIFTNNPSVYPQLGPDSAKTTVIYFGDYQCPFCGMAEGLASWTSQYASKYGDLIGVVPKLQQLAQQGKIKLIYGSMSFLGQESVYASEAGLCANEQGKFWEMHDAIFAAQTQGENSGKYNKDKLEIIAQGVSGLDQSKFKNCLESDKELSNVKKAAQETSTAAQGTPTFYVNGKKVQSSWASIQAAIGA